MNNWHDEYMAEFHRLEILTQVEQIRLEKLAVTSRVDRPRFFHRAMFSFANWMISTGNQLRKRYTQSSPVDEIAAVDRNRSHTGSLAPW